MFGSKKNKGSQESLNEAGGLEYENTPLNGEDAYGEYEDDYGYNDYDSYDEDEYDDEYDEYDDDDYDDGQPRSLGHTVAYMAAVLIVSLVIAICMWFAADDVLALTKPDNVVTITIEEGDTLEDVAQNLADHGLVRYKSLFILYGRFSHAEEKFSAGTFELNQLFDYHALVNGLAASSETRKTVTLTFPEGYTSMQIFEMLADNDVCSLDELKDAAANYEFEYDYLESIPYGEANRLEGYLFPDTYEFYAADDPVRVINKFLQNFDTKFTDSMQEAITQRNADIRQRMEEEGSFSQEEIDNAMLDTYKVLTIASLIEKEAGNDQERSFISSVIYNRLTTRVHELLQIDATVEYALGEHKTELTANDLGVDNPYNTYKYKGLPPGPIASPGLSSIMAALYPEDTEYYFYALNAHGTHNFFFTYMDQQDFLNGITTDVDPLPEKPSESAEDAIGETDGEAAPEDGEETGEAQPEGGEEPQEVPNVQ